MSNIAVITVEGVLRRNSGDGIIREGLTLYAALTESHKVALVSNSLDEAKVEHWLKISGMTDHVYFFPARNTDPFEVGGTRMKQIELIRATQHSVDFVVEPDPDICARLLYEGVPVLNYLHPSYSNPSFRPDWNAEPKAWGNLVAEVERQETIRAADVRVHSED